MLVPLYRILFFLWAINFLAFGVVGMGIGGDAMNGHVENGHYFLANHGHLTEVSKATYTYSYWHVLSVIFTTPIAFFAAIADALARRKKRREAAQNAHRS